MSTKPPNTPSESSQSFLRWFRALVLLGVIAWLAYSVYQNAVSQNEHSFKLGLDLAGGSHLVYEADISDIEPKDVPDLMNVLRDVIERRVNIFGVSEPIVQVESSSFVTDEPVERLVVELPGVTDISEAVRQIGQTPLLEFKLLSTEQPIGQGNSDSLESLREPALDTKVVATDTATSNLATDPAVETNLDSAIVFIDTGLTGRYFKRAEPMLPQSSQGPGFSSSPYLNIEFNAEGAQLFEDITRAHVGEPLAIFLDGEMLSAPVINEAITGGRAVITGDFTVDEVKALAQNLNFGALPVPIVLQSTQTIGASLGAEVLEKGMQAALYGFGLVLLFMLVWYRLPGFIAGVALLSYITIMLALFQFIPVTLTAAGLAGFVLSLGMAVDANVLVFERLKEEYRSGVPSREAARVGFARAWSAIRDGNITSLLSALILFWFGTSMVKGFALVFGLGTIVSMFSALVVTRTLLLALPSVVRKPNSILARLFDCGLPK